MKELPLLCTASVVRNFLNNEVGSWPARAIDLSKPMQCPRGQSHKPEFVRARILKNIRRVESGCWNWQKKINNEGYGVITISQRSQFVHRASFRVFVGEIPDGTILRHKCDNPKCCNPEHLELGTLKDNTWDAINRGRFKRVVYKTMIGDSNPATKIKSADIQKVMEMLSQGMTQQSIANIFGVSQSVIGDIKRGKRKG